MAEPLIATEDLVKDYHLGTRRIHALRKVSRNPIVVPS